MDDRSLALLELGRALLGLGYRFTTTTPATHRRLLARRERARDLRDVFGWSLPFARSLLPSSLLELLVAADALENSVEGALELTRSRVRYSSLGDALYVHSAFPTEQADAVFFGPDTYRFCALLERAAPIARSVLDVGCGSGAGGLSVPRAGVQRLVLSDINERALVYAQINATLQGRTVELVHSDLLANVSGTFDLIVANPPYMRDESARVYRDGGGTLGEGIALRIVREATERLAPQGTLILYTGTAIVDGEDVFRSAVSELVGDLKVRYEELDPDVFGEELERPGYERVERIAAVALTLRRTRA